MDNHQWIVLDFSFFVHNGRCSLYSPYFFPRVTWQCVGQGVNRWSMVLDKVKLQTALWNIWMELGLGFVILSEAMVTGARVQIRWNQWTVWCPACVVRGHLPSGKQNGSLWPYRSTTASPIWEAAGDSWMGCKSPSPAVSYARPSPYELLRWFLILSAHCVLRWTPSSVCSLILLAAMTTQSSTVALASTRSCSKVYSTMRKSDPNRWPSNLTEDERALEKFLPDEFECRYWVSQPHWPGASGVWCADCQPSRD